MNLSETKWEIRLSLLPFRRVEVGIVDKEWRIAKVARVIEEFIGHEDTESRLFGRGQIAVFNLENIDIHLTRQIPGSKIVRTGNLLYQEVWGRKVDMERRRRCNRAVGIVRSNTNPMMLRSCGDEPDLPKAAGVTHWAEAPPAASR